MPCCVGCGVFFCRLWLVASLVSDGETPCLAGHQAELECLLRPRPSRRLAKPLPVPVLAIIVWSACIADAFWRSCDLAAHGHLAAAIRSDRDPRFGSLSLSLARARALSLSLAPIFLPPSLPPSLLLRSISLSRPARDDQPEAEDCTSCGVAARSASSCERAHA